MKNNKYKIRAKKLADAISSEIIKRENWYGKKSEKYQDSDDGETFMSDVYALQEAYELILEASDNI